MYSAAMSSPGDGVARPWRASDARKETSALRSLGRRRAAMRWASGSWPWAASMPAAGGGRGGLEIVGAQARGDALGERKLAWGREHAGGESGEEEFCGMHEPMITAAGMLEQVDDAAAVFGAAAALHLFDVLGEAVIHRQFLASADGALAHVEDVALDVHGAEIGIATVVDDLGARAAERPVERPIIVQREKVSDLPIAPPLGLDGAF